MFVVVSYAQVHRIPFEIALEIISKALLRIDEWKTKKA